MVLLWCLVSLGLVATVVAFIPSLGYRTVRGQWLDLRRSRRAWCAVNLGAAAAFVCFVALFAVSYYV